MSGAYLLLLNVARVPPHLAIAVDGKLFTLSVKGPTVESDLASLLRTIRHRSIESIFIRLKIPPHFSIEEVRSEIKKNVLAYPRVDIGLATCLAPIKDFCSSIYSIDVQKVSFIYELLPKLEAIDVLGGCYQINLEKHLQEGNYVFSSYTMDDINAEIKRASMILTM